MSTNWTPQQRLAIKTKGRNVLVTASAGTGKTTVLSKRCVDILSDTTDVTDVSQILVLTFTEASAEEMKSRIAVELANAASSTGSSYLRHQKLLLDAAHISTIDAFCKRMITENFHVLGIDPTFGIIDPDEQKLIKSEILEEIVEEAWGEEGLAQGMLEILNGRALTTANNGFLANVFSINGFLGSVDSPQEWISAAEGLTEIESLCGSTPADCQKQIILEKLTECLSMLDFALLLDAKFTENRHWSEYINTEYVAFVQACICSLQKDTDTYKTLLSEFAPARIKAMPKGFDKELSELIKAPVNAVKDEIKKFAEMALINADYEELILPAANFQTKILLELVRRFNARYSEVKKKLNCLDFADIEHLMLKLLNESPGTADNLRNAFKYIFVDEYQDTNFLQQAILDRISRDDNVFVVGDIKQSIYAFRQAKPEIFIELLKDAADTPEANNKPLRVDLSDNFRSRRQVLDFANVVFSRIMTEDIAGADYDEKAMLQAGFEYDEKDGDCFVELNFIDENSSDLSEAISPSQRQAALVADRISELIAGKTEVYDKSNDGYRPVEYGDIVILMRSPSTSVNDYLEILRLAGIPVISQSSSGYFQAAEISDMICLLKLLDNPRRDIELAAVLRSPLFGFTNTELALIRANTPDKKTVFYDCVLAYAAAGTDNDLQQKLRSALGKLSDWRAMVRRQSLADLIWHIYRETGYLSFVSGLANGKQRRANLLKLHDRAIQFEGFTTSSQTASLTRFVEFIEKLDSEKHDWAPAQPDASADNAVRIMSVHNSKGLEFPIVFLTELNRSFNNRDIVSACLYDNENKLGIKIASPENGEMVASITHQIIAAEKNKTMLAEEMRILYVAMTRARERLILTASAKGKKPAEIVQSCSVLAGEPLRSWQLKSAKSHLDWLLYALGNQKKLQRIFRIDSDFPADSDLFTVSLLNPAEIDTKINNLRQKQQLSEDVIDNDSIAADQLLTKIKQSLEWKYPYLDAARTDAKMSVTELTHRDDEFSRYTGIDFKRLPASLLCKTDRSGRIDPRQIGTATHLVIENIDLSRPVTSDSLTAVIDDLKAYNLVTPQTAEAINVNSIINFFSSKTGKFATDSANTVMREWPFIFALDPKQVDCKSSDEQIVVQGIIDMIIDTPEGLVIVDFKTDNVSSEDASERAQAYKKQIQLYSGAASAILGKKVISAHLYFLKPALAIEII